MKLVRPLEQWSTTPSWKVPKWGRGRFNVCRPVLRIVKKWGGVDQDQVMASVMVLISTEIEVLDGWGGGQSSTPVISNPCVDYEFGSNKSLGLIFLYILFTKYKHTTTTTEVEWNSRNAVLHSI